MEHELPGSSNGAPGALTRFDAPGLEPNAHGGSGSAWATLSASGIGAVSESEPTRAGGPSAPEASRSLALHPRSTSTTPSDGMAATLGAAMPEEDKESMFRAAMAPGSAAGSSAADPGAGSVTSGVMPTAGEHHAGIVSLFPAHDQASLSRRAHATLSPSAVASALRKERAHSTFSFSDTQIAGNASAAVAASGPGPGHAAATSALAGTTMPVGRALVSSVAVRTRRARAGKAVQRARLAALSAAAAAATAPPLTDALGSGLAAPPSGLGRGPAAPARTLRARGVAAPASLALQARLTSALAENERLQAEVQRLSATDATYGQRLARLEGALAGLQVQPWRDVVFGPGGGYPGQWPALMAPPVLAVM